MTSPNSPEPGAAPATKARAPFFVLLTSHWLSIIGTVLIVTAVCTVLFLIPFHLRAQNDNPYRGIVAFVIVPMVFFAGLALVPIGAWFARRKVGSQLSAISDKKAAWTRFAWVFGAATMVNVAIGTQVTYKALHHMETAEFCGSCHVMAPEERTHKDSPHAQIACAECHVGDGAGGLIKSKIAGARQFMENTTDSFHRPIPSALATDRLTPAKQTCEECHRREKPGDVRVRVLDSFAEDEANSHTQTVLSMQVGGSVLGGIHGRHLDPNLEIQFGVSDPDRQDVVWVESHDKRTGEVRRYTKSGWQDDPNQKVRRLTMECVDCHNRIGHALQSPTKAIDGALASGQLPTTLPWIKKTAMGLLKAEYTSHEDAATKIPAALLDIYKREHAGTFAVREKEIADAGKVLAEIHNRNVYPDLKVTWGTYPDNIGHTDSKGCLRCHAGEHSAPDGKSITNNCFVCHYSAAVDEADPEILQTLGISKVLAKARKK
jgi:nitrate/TMAO reductase-like tetraheme cytochrome c subunit